MQVLINIYKRKQIRRAVRYLIYLQFLIKFRNKLKYND